MKFGSNMYKFLLYKQNYFWAKTLIGCQNIAVLLGDYFFLTHPVDIQREIRNLFIRTNVLKRKVACCSLHVKKVVFKAYCMCFYDIALWSSFSVGSLDKLRSCYNKCIKLFFAYSRFSSLTTALLGTGLPSFDTVLFNYRVKFKLCILENSN